MLQNENEKFFIRIIDKIQMKKFSRILAVLVMATMLVLTITTCGNKNESKVNGKTYAFESYTLNGEDATETITAMYSEQTCTFKDGGACEQKMVWTGEMAELMGTDPVIQNGTYEENGDKVTVTFKMEDEDDTVMEFTVDSDTIKLIEEESTTVYKLKANS